MLKATDNFFNNIHTGNFVEVWWNGPKLYPWDGYGKRGVVFLITRNYIAVRTPAGYAFCVGRHHVAVGVKVRPLDRSEAQCTQCSGSRSRSRRVAKAK
jgi:hypothetical protein